MTETSINKEVCNKTVKCDAVKVLGASNLRCYLHAATYQRLTEHVLHCAVKPWLVRQFVNHRDGVLQSVDKQSELPCTVAITG